MWFDCDADAFVQTYIPLANHRAAVIKMVLRTWLAQYTLDCWLHTMRRRKSPENTCVHMEFQNQTDIIRNYHVSAKIINQPIRIEAALNSTINGGSVDERKRGRTRVNENRYRQTIYSFVLFFRFNLTVVEKERASIIAPRNACDAYVCHDNSMHHSVFCGTQ